MSSNMSAGGESSSEQVMTSPSIVAHEADGDNVEAEAWEEYDALDAVRHRAREREYGRPPPAVQSAPPTALSIMRRQRAGSEDAALARKNLLDRNKGNNERGERVPPSAVDRRHPIPPRSFPYPPDVVAGSPSRGIIPPRHPMTVDYSTMVRDTQERALWEQKVEIDEFHRYYYENDPYYGPYRYGFRGYDRGPVASGGDYHAPMPSFLMDRHREMMYGPAPDMGMMREGYLPKGGSVDNMSLSDHGPRSSSKGRPSNVSRPVVVDQQPPRESQGQQVHVQPQSTTAINVSPQRLALNNGRAYQEMDWKQDRLWREDNHTQTTSAYLNQAPVHTTNQVPSHMSGRLAYAPCSKNQQVRDCPPPNCAFQSQPPQKTPIQEAPTSYPHRPPPKKTVSFNNLEIRTYETILGDNPSCSTGPSLGLGWRYDPSHFQSTIDEYERHQSQQGYDDPRPEDLVLHRFEREAILLSTGYTKQDLAESVRGITKVKNRRRQTVHNLPVAWVEERIEGCRRTLKRFLLNKGRTRSMYDEWKLQELANGAGPQGWSGRGILIKRRSQ